MSNHHTTDTTLPSVRRWSMFVGVNHYRDKHIPPLRFCVNDAQALHDLLVTSPHSGYAPERAHLLLSDSPGESAGHTPATRRNILQHLQNLARQAQPEDMLLFYFAGHGQSLDQEVYLVPADAEPNDMMPDTAVPLSRVKHILETSSARTKAIILDACYTGVALRDLTKRALGAPAGEILERLLEESEGLAILHSTARSDAAFEWAGMQHGVFTYYLLEGLRGDANERKDGRLTVTEIHRYVAAKVEAWARQHQISMRPTVEFKGRSELILATLEFTDYGRPSELAADSAQVPDMHYASAVALLASLRGGERGFVGRIRELQRVLNLVHTAPGMASLIIGGPGFGKTSFLNQIRYRLDGESAREVKSGSQQFYVVSIEPGALSSCNDFAAQLHDGLLRRVNLTNVQPFDRTHGLDTFGAFSARLEDIQQRVPGATFVVLMDEFDKIFHNLPDLEQQRIRELINTLTENERLRIVFVLSVLRELPQFYASRFPADVFTLHALTRAENDQLVQDLLHIPVSLAEEQLAWIYDFTGGHPYLTRLLFAKLLDQVPGSSLRSSIQDEDLETAATSAVRSDRADLLFDGVYGKYLNDDQRYVMLSLAANGQRVLTTDEYARMRGQHKTAVKELVRRDYLLEQADGAYRMRAGLFFDWLLAWEGFDREAERLGVAGQQPEHGAPLVVDRPGLCIDPATRRIYIEGREIDKPLPDLPYRALVYLAQRAGVVVSKDDLAETLWPADFHDVDDQRIAAVISRLRQALGDRNETYLQTLHKQGYRLQHVTFIGPASAQG